MTPSAFLKARLGPKSFGNVELGFGVFRHQNGDDIEPMRQIANAEDLSVDLCRPRDLTLFSFVDIGDDRREFVRPPCFDLDKAESFTVNSNNVDLARDQRAFAVASDRDLEIGNHKAITVLDQEFGGKAFAVFAEGTCASGLWSFILFDDRQYF